MIDDPEPQLPPGLALAWGLTRTTTRGRKPSQSVEQVVHAAVELADTDGFAALSMPNIARKVGLTANAVYRYISSRDELLVLLAEAGWGPPPDLAACGKRWREAATTWTRAWVDRCDVHPWLLDLPTRGAPMTPNMMRWAEVLLESLTSTGLSHRESLSCALLLDGYARRIAHLSRDLRTSDAAPVQSAAVARFLQPLLHERGFPILASMMTTGIYDDRDGVRDTEIEFGLNRILDGIDTLIATKRRAP